jgi:hypothetical protein
MAGLLGSGEGPGGFRVAPVMIHILPMILMGSP